MNPAVIDVQIGAENWPETVLLWILKGSSWIHRISDISQKNLYVGKFDFLGPKIIYSKIKSFAKNAITPVIKTAKKDLIICHLKISRCSKNDISLSTDTSTKNF